jgi:hypothetical protein
MGGFVRADGGARADLRRIDNDERPPRPSAPPAPAATEVKLPSFSDSHYKVFPLLQQIP